MNANDVSNELYTKCGVTAPVALWISAGMEFCWHGEERWSMRADTRGYNTAAGLTDGEIMEARVHTGDAGEQALVWLIQERRRRAEERAKRQSEWDAIAARQKSDDAAIHAARIRRQAAELECLARGIKTPFNEGKE